jgi:trimethylamine:corrinoid methyltransferase-like protein
MLPHALVPSDISSGFGGTDQAAGASYELLVVDAWVWDAAKELIREFSADDETISFDTIRSGALDNNFLSKRHTAAHFRKEFSTTRNPEAVLSSRGQPRARGDLLFKAKDEVVKILKNAKPVTTKRESADMQKVIDKVRKG